MTDDRELVDRVRAHLAHRPGVTEQPAYDGLGFLLQGNLAVAVIGDDLLVRLSAEQHAGAIAEPHARAFGAAPGFILVAPGGTATDAGLGIWIDRAVAHVATVPARKPRATTRKPVKRRRTEL